MILQGSKFGVIVDKKLMQAFENPWKLDLQLISRLNIPNFKSINNEDSLACVVINDKEVKTKVKECADFAEESPYPQTEQMYDMVYEQKDYPFIS